MEEVRQLVQEEGREARNLVAFHVAVDTPTRISRKPPRCLGGPAAVRRVPPRPARRSASAGRDKRSELRARYWALLFGDLQRAIGEIYNTVEAHENLNECQEVILVLENYTRDFKALGEWFRLKWEYDNTPPPQRPQSLAWEIRKTDFVRPESRRTHSVKSSPSVSGKNSPCLSGHNTPSGKNSPNLTGKASPGSGKISPRISSGHSSTSPKANIEFFSSKIAASKVTAKPEPKLAKETSRLSDITEKDVKENNEENPPSQKEDVKQETKIMPTVEIGKAKETPNVSPKQVVIKSPKRTANQDNSKQDISKQDNPKQDNPKPNSPKQSSPKQDIAKTVSNDVRKSSTETNSAHAREITAKLDAMENEFLAKQLSENQIKNENMINRDIEVEKVNGDVTISTIETSKTEIGLQEVPKVKPHVVDDNEISPTESESPTKSEDNFADISNESSSKSVEGKNLDTSENLEEKSEVTQVNTSTTESIPEVSKKISEEVKDQPKTTENGKESPKPIDPKDLNNKSPKIPDQNGPIDNKDDIKKETDKKDLKAVEAKASARPAYSQAAAKPKPVTAPKTEVKTPTKTTTLIRSKTVVEIRPSSAPKPQRQFPKKNQVNKCSYPFNLTTGRTSLFDSPATANKNVLPKKPMNKNVHMASGDTKSSQNKADVKKGPPRPTTLKINEKDSKKEILNPALGKIKDYDEYSSSDTIVTQIDMSRIESSESLKTLVPEELMIDDVANSIEVLNVDSNKNDNEGWLTVKSRRLSRESKKQSKSHWAQRFHQPSATTSLPTLNMIESPKQETKTIIDSPKTAKLDRAKSEQPQAVKPEKVVKVLDNVKVESKDKDPAMIRQKSDVTGLKTKSSRSKALTKKAEKAKDDESKDEETSDLIKNRLHSSLESLTTGLARSQESTEEAFDFDKWKEEFKSTFKYFDDDDQILNHTDILETADPSERSEIAEMTSQIEENEKKLGWALDFQSEVDQRKLCEEEDLLNRQIMELQQVSDIDLDTETDDTETDAEILCEEALGRVELVTGGTLSASLEDRYETALAGMSWAERVDTLGALEALVARDPGRAQQLHAKLSQGIRRRGSLQDALRRLQAKQARAERQRIEYQTERAKKIHTLLAKVEEVKVAKNQLIEEKRLRMEKRLQKAAENRDQHLKDIVRKAHDEEEKLREIAFIKQLEAENRRHDFLDQCRSHTTRLRQMRRERLGKLEQKAAREAAVGARRLALEAARRRRVEALLERRRQRDARRDTLDQLKRHERHQAAKEKAEGVKSRLNALAAAAELEADALRSRIRDKQDASQQRLESHLQAIREKATTGPRQATTSESQDQTKEERELAEQAELAERTEQERRERERQKAIKKRARKIKLKLIATGDDNNLPEEHLFPPAESSYPVAGKLNKVVNALSNIITPLYDDIPDHQQNGEEKKQPKSKKKAVNGEEEDTKKDSKKKKKKEVEKEMGEVKENNNNEELAPEEPECSNSNSSGARRKKKRDNKNDKPKLSKTNSVCSSLSDMSRGSGGRGERAKVVVDVPMLERQLNELNRLMEIFEKNSSVKVVCGKVQALRLLGRLLAAAAEQPPLRAMLSAKSLTTGVSIIARVAGACSVSAAYLVTTNTPVHMLTLLADQLEKDMSDAKELELAKQLSDCLSVVLDSVLCSTRVYEDSHYATTVDLDAFKKNCHTIIRTSLEKGEAIKEEIVMLSMLRNRAHMLISYLCLSGSITRAEKAGEARESIQTLLTVCADLCHACDADLGPELQSAIQSLRCALGTGVCGSRAEFCVLFARGAQIGEKEGSGGFVRAARTAHLLRALAELDYHIVQDAFGEAGWPLEFRAAVARLLSQHAPSDKEAPRTTALRLSNQRLDQTLSETMVLDLIVLVGFVVVNNPQLQETILEGWSVIKTLCTLPANWLVSKVHSKALLPTLAALACRPSAAAAIASELSMEMIEEFMDSPEAQDVKLVQVLRQHKGNKKTGKK